jgi:hypothetical protein
MLLRIALLVFAVSLVFDSGLVYPVTKELSHNTQVYIASAVGVGASVPPTELNVITAELTKKEQDLLKREVSLRERELNVGLGGEVVSTNNNYSTYILSILLFIILVLIVVNYALDYRRYKQILSQTTTYEGA